MRRVLSRAGVPHHDCLEKGELRARVLQAIRSGAVTLDSPRPDGGDADDSDEDDEDEQGDEARVGAGNGTDGVAGDSGSSGTIGTASAAGGAAAAAAVAAAATPAADAREAPRDGGGGGHDPAGGGSGASDGESDGSGGGDADLENWAEAVAPSGQVYYYHRITRATRWQLPTKRMARKLERRLSERQVEVQARQQERVRQLAVEEAKRSEVEQKRDRAQAGIDSRVSRWASGKGIRQMLATLNHILSERRVTDDVAAGALGSSDQVKRAYLKAVRKLHPDKLTGLPLEQRLEAQAVFAVLSTAHAEFAKHGDRGAGGPGTGYGSSTRSPDRRSVGSSRHGHSGRGHAYAHVSQSDWYREGSSRRGSPTRSSSRHSAAHTRGSYGPTAYSAGSTSSAQSFGYGSAAAAAAAAAAASGGSYGPAGASSDRRGGGGSSSSRSRDRSNYHSSYPSY